LYTQGKSIPGLRQRRKGENEMAMQSNPEVRLYGSRSKAVSRRGFLPPYLPKPPGRHGFSQLRIKP